jgi:transcription elongation GreA/GreB family factor
MSRSRGRRRAQRMPSLRPGSRRARSRAPRARSSSPAARNYAEEYARKESLARSEGFASYWHKRKARASVRDRSVYPSGKAAA